MLGLLPFIALSLLGIVFRLRQTSWRQAYLQAAVVWGILVVASTEILSLFHSLAFRPVCLFWIIVIIFSAVLILRNRNLRTLSFPIVKRPLALTGSEKFYLLATIVIVLAVGLTAIIAPPNTWDVLSYHLGRVMHWIQNHCLDNYPTHITAQLTHSPGMEFIFLHLVLLSGNDHWVNLPQWLGLLLTLCAVSLIFKHFGADRKKQLFSVLLTATIPMLILQGSSAKNDLLSTAWLAIAAVFLLDLKAPFRVRDICLLAGALGLAVLVKATAIFFVLPLLFLPVISRRLGRARSSIMFVVLTLSGILLLNLGYISRLSALLPWFPSLISTRVLSLSNTFSFANFISNIIRNLATELGTSVKPLNQIIIQGISLSHQWLGRSPQEVSLPFTFHNFPLHEDHASNTWHVLLFIFCAFLFFIKKALRTNRALRHYLYILLIAGVLFNLGMQWSPWINRYHLPYLVLASPFIAYVLSSFSPRVPPIIATILFLTALPYVLCNPSRPLVSFTGKSILAKKRIAQYFINKPAELQTSLSTISEKIAQSSCRDIGLIIPGDWGDYLFWVFFREQGIDVHVEDIFVPNCTNHFAYPRGEFEPCAIISSFPEHKELPYKNHLFKLTCATPSLFLLEKSQKKQP